MDAYIAFEKYIVKEEKKVGVGVPVAFEEQIAQKESVRRKDVDSFNKWMCIEIPTRKLFLDCDASLNNQSNEVLKMINDKDFLLTLFISEARTLYSQLDDMLIDSEDKSEQSKRLFDDFCAEKYGQLMTLSNGAELIKFVNDRCRTHDMAKSSALIYSAGIKGSLYSDTNGQRVLLYNAAEDIVPIEVRSAKLPDSKLIL